MFCDRENHMHHHGHGFAMLTLASIALTIPFIFYAKDIADSLRKISDRKTIT